MQPAVWKCESIYQLLVQPFFTSQISLFLLLQSEAEGSLRSSSYQDTSNSSYHSHDQSSKSGSEFSANVSGFAESSIASNSQTDASSISSDSNDDSDTILDDSHESSDDLLSYEDSVSSSQSSSAFMTQPGAGKEKPISSTELRQRFATPKQKPEPGLLQSVKTGDISAVRNILRSGFETNATDSCNRTALHVACAFGRLDMVKLFLSQGADVDIGSMSGKTAIHEACIGGHYNVLKLLLSEVADLDVVDKKGMSAAHYCALNGEVNCLSLLCNQVP